MNRIRMILVAASICLLTGCAVQGNQEVKKGPVEEKVAKGYQEEDIPLTFLTDSEKIIGMVKDQGKKIKIYTMDNNEKTCNVYEMQEDRSFKKTTLTGTDSYMKDASAPWAVSAGEDGSIYFLYYDKDYIPHIIREKDEEVTEVAGDIIKKHLDSDTTYPSWVDGTADGGFIISYMSSISSEQYDSSGKLMYEYPVCSGETNIRQNMSLGGTVLVAENQVKDGFVLYDITTGKVKNEIDAPDASYRIVSTDEEGDFYYADEKGIHHVSVNGKIVETLIDTQDMPALMERKEISSFEIGENNSCYVLYRDLSGSGSLKYYSYADTSDAKIDKTLRIIGMSKSNTIARAISEFEKNYPQVKIEFQAYEEVASRGTLAETLRIINAEILSGEKGPDLILLDKLPVESYIEKGALADLTGVFEELEKNDGLLENIRPSEGEKIYLLPTRFSIPIMTGTEHAIAQLDSITTINQFLQDPGDTALISHATYQVLAESLLALNYDEITENLPDEAKIKAYMDAVTNLGNYINAENQEFTEADRQYFGRYLLNLGTPSVLGNDKAGVEELNSLDDLARPATYEKEYNQKVQLINGIYIPYDSIGINSMSAQRQEAEDFLKILFSSEQQSIDMGEGFPVNKEAFDSLKAVVSDQEIGVSYQEDGQEVIVTYNNPDDNDVNNFKALVKGIKKPLLVDESIYEILLEGVKRVYNGETSSEQAANDVTQKLKLYVAES